MNNTLVPIKLYGKLGTQFGRVHMKVVESAEEAVRALCYQIPGFREHLQTSHKRGVTYAVFLGKRNLTKEELTSPCNMNEIRIAPILMGSKAAGLLQTILGIALIVVGAFITEEFPILGPALVSAGMGMTLGGVVQMLSPQPKNGNSAGSGASYNFNGAVNTSSQGVPVPVLYGRMIVGSAVISAGIYSKDTSPTAAQTTAGGLLQKGHVVP